MTVLPGEGCVVCCDGPRDGAAVGAAGGPVAAGGSGRPARVPPQGGPVSRQVCPHGELFMHLLIFKLSNIPRAYLKQTGTA